MTKLRPLAIALLLLSALTGCKGTPEHAPEAWDGLQHQSISGPGTLYLRPDMSFRAYRTVMLDPLVVTVDKNWLPTRDVATGAVVGPHPVSQRELQYIDSVLGSQFQRVVAARLAAGGYQLVTKAGDDTLLVSPALANVYLSTPEDSMDKSLRPGTMTLVMDLSDAGSSRSLARYIEQRRGRMGSLEVPLSVTDNAEYRQAIEEWAGRLVELLDRMRRIREPR